MQEGSKKIGLVLSGGGARAFAHLGVLKYLEEHQIPIHSMACSSAGALVGAFYAAGFKIEEIYDIMAKFPLYKAFKVRPGKLGFMDLSPLEKELSRMLKRERFEELEIPISVCVSDVHQWRPVFISEGFIMPAVIAAMAVPMLFKPYRINGEVYWDGGMLANLPYDALPKGWDISVGVNLVPPFYDFKVKSILGLILKSSINMVAATAIPYIAKFDYYLEPQGINRYNGFRRKYMDRIFELGYREAKAKLNTLIV